MSAKGRVKSPKKQMPCLHEQTFLGALDEQSEPKETDAVLW